MVRADYAIITANYGDYDEVKPTFVQCDAAGNELNVEWICVTDDYDLVTERQDLGWTFVFDSKPGVHPNLAAKEPKMLPWNYTDAPFSIWLDASFRVVSDQLITEVVPYARPIAQFDHPWRQCLYAEAEESERLPKYAGLDFKSQVSYYRVSGHPEGWGLWATGVIVRQHTPEVKKFGEHWFAEVNDFTFQDQVSEPYSLAECGLRPTNLPGTHFANPWLKYEGSGRH